MASKKVSINIDKKAKIEYPTASIAANIVPAMRTPDGSFPLRVSVLATELDANGNLGFVLGDDDLPSVAKVILERVQPEGKETLCGFKSPYHVTWAYSLAHAIVSFIQGGNVKGRVYATTFAHNYRRVNKDGETVLDLAKLFESGFMLLVEMPASKSMPPTMGSKNSCWIIPISALANYVLAVSDMTALADSYTEQRAVVVDESTGEVEILEFEL